MPNELLLIISIIVCFVAGISKKYYTKACTGGVKQINFYNAIISVFAIATFLIWGGFGKASLFTVLLALLFGLITALQYLFTLKAISIGSWAYTTVISCLSTLIPTCSGWIFWGEPISWVQIVGVLLFVVCFIFSADLSSDENKKLSLKWLLYVSIAFICTGGIGVLQKVFASSSYAGQLNAFLIIAFIFAFLFATSIFTFITIKDRKSGDVKIEKEKTKSINVYYSFLWIAIIAVCGIFVAINNKLNLYLSGVFESAFLFPVLNGSNILLTTLFSVLVFKDKLKVKQWIGFGVGIIALFFLCNPFGF